MTHFSEESLAEYVFDPDHALQRSEIEKHVAECAECSAALAFIRSIEEGFADGDAWDIVAPKESRREEARALAARIAKEDAEAEEILGDLLLKPARTAWTNLAVQRRSRTLGVARRLIRAANEVSEREPLDALTFAEAATEIAERLSGYPSNVIANVRGTAWTEQANALRLLARYDSALDALNRADREFKKVSAAPLGPASVNYVRAIVHYERGDLPRAAELAGMCAAVLSTLHEFDRHMRARHLIANISFAQGDVRGARATYEEILAWGISTNNPKWIAREHNTVGRCALELRELTAAKEHFRRSSELFLQLGCASEAGRPAWGEALVELASGNAAEALKHFDRLRADFHRRAMLADEALVALDSMDALYALGRRTEIRLLATEIMLTFTAAGMLNSALAAFGYLRDAARNITPPRIDYVRRFIRSLEREPSLLFIPPQD
jgi:tetratricopeptide (TPR) repeat protein